MTGGKYVQEKNMKGMSGAVCTREECGGHDRGQCVQYRSKVMVSSMCRKGVHRVWQGQYM